MGILLSIFIFIPVLFLLPAACPNNYNIETAGGVEITADLNSKLSFYILEDVNMRAKPTIDSDIIRILSKNAYVKFIETDKENKEWALVGIMNGKGLQYDFGYIKKAYLDDPNGFLN